MTADELFGAAPGAANDLRPGSALPGPPRELPYSTVDLSGRTGETAALLTLLRAAPGSGKAERDGRVVVGTIDGMAGVGKSAVAVHVAHQVASDYPDGQLYVNLRAAAGGLPPLLPIEALTRMLRSLGLADGAIPYDVDEVAACFRSMTSGRKLFVLLDDASSADHVRDLLPAGPGCAVLITSRRVLATVPGAHRLHLDVLPDHEAFELLCRITGPERLAGEGERLPRSFACAEGCPWRSGSLGPGWPPGPRGRSASSPRVSPMPGTGWSCSRQTT